MLIISNAAQWVLMLVKTFLDYVKDLRVGYTLPKAVMSYCKSANIFVWLEGVTALG